MLPAFWRYLLPMFPETNVHLQDGRGLIEVICGPMFSGKTEELLRRLRRARIANIDLAIFKPDLDTRYGKNRIVSHDANYFPSMPLGHSSDVLRHYGRAKVVALDEVQFFDEGIVEVCSELAKNGIRVIAAGLDMDYLGQPFHPMPKILSIADYVTKLSAICQQCGWPAIHSYRKNADSQQVMLGEKDSYEPRCRKCFHLGDEA